MHEYGVETTWTEHDIVILVRSLSNETTRSCIVVFVCTYRMYNARYARIKQRFSCTSWVRQRQLVLPPGNMRINRRKIYMRNANIRAVAHVLSEPPQCCTKSKFFSCDYPVLPSANISTAKLIGLLSEKK